MTTTAPDIIGSVLPVIFEDSHIVAVHKPANMFSVPIKSPKVREVDKGDPPQTSFETVTDVSSDVEAQKVSSRGKATTSKRRRFEEWADAVKNAINSTSCEAAIDCLKGIKNHNNVPRQEKAFKDYLGRSFKEFFSACAVDEESVKAEVWTAVCRSDVNLHRLPLEVIAPENRSALEILLSRRDGEEEGGVSSTLFVVHRLDCETSGVLVFAKNAMAAAELCRQFRSKEVRKLYLAEIHGRPSLKPAIVVDFPLGPHPDPAMKPRYVVRDDASGRDARTLLKILYTTTATHESTVETADSGHEVQFSFADTPELREARFAKGKDSPDSDSEYSLVMLEPITGRSHQLRVHMQALGCPIIGDSLYSPSEVQGETARLALHALKLQFRHPATGVKMELTAPLEESRNYHETVKLGSCRE